MKVFMFHRPTSEFIAQRMPNGTIHINGPCVLDHSGEVPEPETPGHLSFLGFSKARIDFLDSVGALDDDKSWEISASETDRVRGETLNFLREPSEILARCELDPDLEVGLTFLHEKYNVPIGQIIMEVLRGRQSTLDRLWALIERAEDAAIDISEQSQDAMTSDQERPSSPQTEPKTDSSTDTGTTGMSASTAATSISTHEEQASSLPLIPELASLSVNTPSQDVIHSNSSQSKRIEPKTDRPEPDRPSSVDKSELKVFLDSGVAQKHKNPEVVSLFKGGLADFLDHYFKPSVETTYHDPAAIESTGAHDLSCGTSKAIYMTPSRIYAQNWAFDIWKKTRPGVHTGAAVLEIELSRKMDNDMHRHLEVTEQWKRFCLANRTVDTTFLKSSPWQNYSILHTLCSKSPAKAYRTWKPEDWPDVRPQLNDAGIAETQVRILQSRYAELDHCVAHMWWLVSGDKEQFACFS